MKICQINLLGNKKIVWGQLPLCPFLAVCLKTVCLSISESIAFQLERTNISFHIIACLEGTSVV